MARAGVTVAWRLFFHPSTMPGLKKLWQSKQNWESSLMGASAPKAGWKRRGSMKTQKKIAFMVILSFQEKGEG
jgi:hypothetical protein